MKKIIILDYTSGEVYVFNYDSNIFTDFSDFCNVINEEYDLNLYERNCNWMIVDELKINIK